MIELWMDGELTGHAEDFVITHTDGTTTSVPTKDIPKLWSPGYLPQGAQAMIRFPPGHGKSDAGWRWYEERQRLLDWVYGPSELEQAKAWRPSAANAQ